MKPLPQRHPLVCAVLFIACFALLILRADHGFLNYLIHTPGALNGDSLMNLLRFALLPAVGIAFVIAFAAAAGLVLLDARFSASSLRVLFAVGLIFGLSGECLFLAGALGENPILCAFIILVLGGILSIAGARRLKSALSVPRPRMGNSWLLALWAGLLAYAVWHIVILALASPVEWDVLAYHLALPKLYAQQGKLIAIPWMIQSHWPHLAELLYVLPIYLHADTMAALLHAGACMLWLAAFYAACRETLGHGVACGATLLLATQPVLLRFAGTAHSDGFWSFFYFLSAYSVWRWDADRQRFRLLWAGLFGGFAMATKLIGLPLDLLLGFWIVWRSTSREDCFRNALLFLIPGMLVVGPWYAWTLVHTGNPIWPFFSRGFGDAGARVIEYAYIQINLWRAGEFMDRVGRYHPFLLILPFLGAWAALAVQRRAFPAFVKFLLFPAPFVLLLFFRQGEFWRFMLPLYPGFCAAIAYGAALLWQGNAGARLIALLLMGTAAAGICGVSENNALFEVAGVQHFFDSGKTVRDGYLTKSLDIYRISAAANDLLLPTDKVLLFGDLRGYYLNCSYLWGDPVNQATINYSALDTAGDLALALRREGVTHVLINEGPLFYRSYPEFYGKAWMLIRALVAARGKRLAQDGPIALYRLS